MFGNVVHVNKAKGFALVKDEHEIKYFAHVKNFLDQLDFDFLTPGSQVEFEPFSEPSGGQNGLRAARIRRVA